MFLFSSRTLHSVLTMPTANKFLQELRPNKYARDAFCFVQKCRFEVVLFCGECFTSKNLCCSSGFVNVCKDCIAVSTRDSANASEQEFSLFRHLGWMGTKIKHTKDYVPCEQNSTLHTNKLFLQILPRNSLCARFTILCLPREDKRKLTSQSESVGSCYWPQRPSQNCGRRCCGSVRKA